MQIYGVSGVDDKADDSPRWPSGRFELSMGEWRVKLRSIVPGAELGYSFVLGGEEARTVGMGRSKKQADLVVDERFPATSRLHCEFVLARNADCARVVVVDKKSMNGLFLNRRRIERAALNVGDKLLFGTVEMSVAVGSSISEELLTPGKSAEFEVLSIGVVPLGEVAQNTTKAAASGTPSARPTREKRERPGPEPVPSPAPLAEQVAASGASPDEEEDEMLASPPKRQRSDSNSGMDEGEDEDEAHGEDADEEQEEQEEQPAGRGMRARKQVDYTGAALDAQISAAIRSQDGTGRLPRSPSSPSPLGKDLLKLGLPTAKPSSGLISGWRPSDSAADIGAVVFCRETNDFISSQGAWYRSEVVDYSDGEGYRMKYDDTRCSHDDQVKMMNFAFKARKFVFNTRNCVSKTRIFVSKMMSSDGQAWIPVDGDLRSETVRKL